MLSDCSSDSVYFTGIGEDRLGRTVCYKLKYDQNEQEWAVSEVNIGQSPVQADWDATSGLAQILNKPAVGKVVRVCSLQGANIVESGICPPRNDGDIYIITFESANIPNTWYVCDPQSYPSFVAEEYVSPNVPTSNFQQVADEMRRRRYSEDDVNKVSGKNLMDVFQRVINCSELEH